MELKEFQTETLAVLRRFLEDARVVGPKTAYEAIVREPDQARRLGRHARAYRALAGLPDVPSVCLRLPTGGGKTVLAARAVAVARDAWIEKDRPLVLWLVPSNAIRRQTAEALKNARHPYRRALDDAFGGRVRVFDIADFADIRPHDVRDRCCVIVGTIQTLRVKSTEGRRVYAHNEDMEPHFSALPRTSQGLERRDGGGVKFSFANLMHIHRPLMIVDEAHNAVTGLSREMQRRVNPSAIVEFTATPRPKSNVLHSVTALELKREEMVKLPVILSEHDTWQSAVNGAVAKRAELAAEAAADPGRVRPIALFQAQPKNGEVTVGVLKNHLIEVERVPEARIAVATGDQRELDGIDLFDPACPVEHVITVQALKEGWDCSFAYVFCSVSRIRSATDVEQLLGRVLRMPFAKRRNAEALNRAYAFLSEPAAGQAARALVDKLVAMGFEEDEARDNIEPAQPALELDGSLFGPRRQPETTFTHTVAAAAGLISALAERTDLAVHGTEGGPVEIVVAGRVGAATERAVAAALPEVERKGFAAAVERYRAEMQDPLSPAERGEAFEVPRLTVEIQGALELADSDVFMEYSDWSLLDHPAKFGENEFAIRETARHYEIDIGDRSLRCAFLSEDEQAALDIDVEGWTQEALVLWLDRRLRRPDIGQSELVRWLSDLVRHLVTTRGISVAALMRCKFVLARKLGDAIAAARREERKRAYRRCLFAPEARPVVSFDNAFAFTEGMYRDVRRYDGHWQLRKHFLGPDRVPAFDGKEDGEEFRCAQAVDNLSEVAFWIRNVVRHPASFWLPTAAGRFYPDFVARLNDDRLLVVEYKGEHLADGADTAEKRAVGELWERASDGTGLFLVVEKEVAGMGVREQLLRKIKSD